MQDIRTLLRYHYAEQYNKREVARFLQLSPGTARNYPRRAESTWLSRPLPKHLTDEALGALLFPDLDSTPDRPQPDWKEVDQQLAGRA